MCPRSPSLEPIMVRAQVRAWQVQHLATPLVVLLDLLLGLGRAAREFAVRVAGIGNTPHHGLKFRVVELQMYAQPRAQIGVALGDHVDAVDGGDFLDVLQPFQ